MWMFRSKNNKEAFIKLKEQCYYGFKIIDFPRIQKLSPS